MSIDLVKAYWDLVKDAEDYFTSGYRRVEPEPDFSLIQKSLAGERSGKAVSSAVSGDNLSLIHKEVSVCRRCPLSQGRNNTVPGEGSGEPLVLIIGEGPGADEDRTGRPFVGRAGHYLDKWLSAINLSRETNCFIGNIVKCRPPGNRDPLPIEIEACLPYLKRQIKALNPKVILALGRVSAQILLGRSDGIGRLRGKFHDFEGIPLLATYHPSAVLRSQESLRPPVWEDLKMLKGFLDNLAACEDL